VRRAMELGADWVEVDVHAVEGALAVIHDATLDRTTNGAGPVAAASLAALRLLDAGQGQRVPLLPEVMDLVEGRAGLNVEMKGAACCAPLASLLEARESSGRLDLTRLLVSSFDHVQLRQMKARMPAVPLGAIAVFAPGGSAAFAEALGARAAVLGLEGLTAPVVEDAHARGIQVYVFTVNEPEDIRRVRSLGADGVFTDFPERVAPAIAG
jgi:glycerophosphoryl diester phosphodiesterase